MAFSNPGNEPRSREDRDDFFLGVLCGFAWKRMPMYGFIMGFENSILIRFHDEHVQFLGAMHADGEGHFDIRCARWPCDQRQG
jgi:hypothetical protein